VKLPGIDKLTIDEAKVRDYLLSPTHPVGRFKARFFNRLGYTQEQWQRLREDLLAIARSEEAQEGQQSDFGQKYEVHGELSGPSRTAQIVVVWILLHGEETPRFVTAFPGGA
jgi:hypothetical protein